jgi:hypothetical protein
MMTAVLVIAAAGTASGQETQNLFEAAGTKQTNKDFEPAPADIETSFGSLEFELEAFPTDETARRLYDELDLQRATQAYLDFNPALSVYGIVKGQIRDFGFKTASDIGVMPGPGLTPSELYLTGNNSTVYAVASLDLKLDGPTVVDLPPGMYGTANDALFKYLVDFGIVGPDQGKGGKYLFLPPGYDGTVPADHFAVRSPSHRIWVMMRGWGDVGTGDEAVEWFSQRLKVYPLATGPRQGNFINTGGIGLNSLAPEDGSAFEMLDEIVQHEPAELIGAEQLGRLATLGIVKGRAFDPDERMQRILDQGAKQGAAMARAIVYASREPDIKYWKGRHWEKMFLYNTTFERNGVNDIDARTLWHYQAIVVSPNLISTTPGAGTAYLTTFRDGQGRFLNGANNYRLRVGPNPPVKNFWALTAYDPVTRSLLDIGGNRNKSVGSRDNPVANPDGSVDVFFGPRAPKGKEKNWVPTNPDKGFFLVFRFYGPLEGYIDKSWVLNDLELIE